MKIHGGKYAGNPVRVAYFLAEKGIDMEFQPVDILNDEHRTDAYFAKNPFRQIPVLELDDGTCISETMAICRYIEGLHPEPNLLGEDPLESAIVDMWQRRVEFNLYLPARAVFRHAYPYVRALEPVQVTAWADLNRPRVMEALEIVDSRLGESPYLAGDRYTVADITLLFALDVVERIEIPPDQAGGNIRRWFNQVVERPPVAKVRDEARQG